MRAARRGRGGLRLAGAIASLLAIFLSAGGHWAVLQSIAYARMLVEFAQEGSLGAAVKKTFDQRYACSLCPKIRDGYNKERKAPPNLGGEQFPEFLGQSSATVFFVPALGLDLPSLSSRHSYFFNAPPKPPPRAA